jgi:hypothetical protein
MIKGIAVVRAEPSSVLWLLRPIAAKISSAPASPAARTDPSCAYGSEEESVEDGSCPARSTVSALGLVRGTAPRCVAGEARSEADDVARTSRANMKLGINSSHPRDSSSIPRQRLCVKMLTRFLLLLGTMGSAEALPSTRATIQMEPKLGLGMAALGRPGYINLGHKDDLPSRDVEAMREHACEVLDEAIRLGMSAHRTSSSPHTLKHCTAHLRHPVHRLRSVIRLVRGLC